MLTRAPVVASQPVTIAILEDDQDTCDLYRMLFEPHGFRPHLFRDSEACCAYIHQAHPDLLIFDVMGWRTPNGLTVLEGLAHELGPTMPPVIIATALTDHQIAGHPVLRQLTKWATLYKPFDIFNLLDTVARLV